MPRVKVDYIVSFSSEDPEHPAANLLQESASGRCWLAAAGSGTASVVLQLARAVRISSLSLGAHRAALVEVLVGRSETPQYEVLVPRCILQSPADARRGSNPDRVRSFSSEQMSEGVREKSWDRVRVVCSQPYDKYCKFGLSFVHIFEPEGQSSATRSRQLTLESLRCDSSEDESFRPGALFAAHLQGGAAGRIAVPSCAEPQTSDKQIRQATSLALKNLPDSKQTHLVKTPLSADRSRHKPSDRRDQEKADKTDGRAHKNTDQDKNRHRDIHLESRNERNANFDNSCEGGEEEQRGKKDADDSRNKKSSNDRVSVKEGGSSSSCKRRDRDGDKKEKERKNRDDHKRDKETRNVSREQMESKKRSHDNDSRQDEECDTDDEIEKFLRKQKRKDNHATANLAHTKTPSKDRTAENAGHRVDNTDHREEAKPSEKSGVLPAFLDGLTFAIDSGVSKVGFDEQLIRRYVLAYGGEIVEEPECANYLLCGCAPAHAPAAPLRADWLWRCHRRARRVRLHNYLLT